MNHSLLRMASIAALGCLAACNPSGQSGAPKGGPGAMGAMPPPEVEVIVASRGNASITQELPGRLAAFRTAQVRARVEGVVEKRLFAEGSDVREGTALFRIDPRSYQSAFDAAKADQALAQLTVDRYKPLLAINAISKQEFDLAQAKLKAADAALTRAKIDLENTTVPAPIAGRIGRELVTEGALVGRNEATPLATIEQIDPIYANFTQSGADVLRLRKAISAGKMKASQEPKIELVLEDGSVYPQPGKLMFTDLAVEPTTGSVSLRAMFPNPKRELLPGAFVRVRFPEAFAQDVILIPQRAVQVGPVGQFVTVVDGEGKAAVAPVKTGGMSGMHFVIAEGLRGGEQVIVNGLQKARPGAPVKPVVLGPDGKPLAVPATEQQPAAAASGKDVAPSKDATPAKDAAPAAAQKSASSPAATAAPDQSAKK